MLVILRAHRGATLLASLTSKLVDSASLRYLRPEFCSRREGIKILLLRQKEKYGMSKKTYRDALFEPCSSRCNSATQYCAFALCSSFDELPRSNFARLADKQACRLGFASLSAPRVLLEARRHKNPSSSPKRKIRYVQKDIPYFWRRRKDLNLRAGYPTYTLSRGASSPLEYFSIVKPY